MLSPDYWLRPGSNFWKTSLCNERCYRRQHPRNDKMEKKLDEKDSIYNGDCEVIKKTSVNYIISFTKISKVKLDNCFEKVL